MQISDKAAEIVRTSNRAKAALMAEFNIGEKTVMNWLDKKDVRFTTPMAIDAIKETTGLSEEEIIVDETKSNTIKSGVAAVAIILMIMFASCNIRLHPGNAYKYHHFYKHQSADSTAKR